MTTLPTHGVLLEFNNLGLYLVGDSGIGKSEIALQLIHQGAALICDDAPDFTIDKNEERIIGHCPKNFYGLMHLHDLGIINVIELFNSNLSENNPARRDYFKPCHSIDFIIELVAADNRLSIISRQTPQQLLTTDYQYWQYQGWTIAGIRIHLYPNRNIAVIIKTAVMQFLSFNMMETNHKGHQITRELKE